MKIDHLDLVAYGPFTDTSLDLSADGLHLVLGANEAGKSSTLAAITDALFGIPLRTTAGFVHHMTRLEIGMTLRDERGEVFAFRRLKKAKDSLRAADGSVLDADALAAFTRGLDRATFTTMFGITHDQLVAGGRDLVAGHGELGELLFGASTGSANLHHTLKELEDRSAVLFKAGGHNPRVNAGISRYKTAASQARDHSLRPRAYDDVRARIRRLDEAVAATRAAIAAHTDERALVHLLVAVLPNLRLRASLSTRLAELAPTTVPLRSGIGAEHRDLQAAREQARARVRAAVTEVERLRAEIDALPLDDRVVAEADVVGALREQRGQYEQAVRDRPSVAAEARDARAKAERLVARLRPGAQVDEARASLRVPAGAAARVLELAEAGVGLGAECLALAGRAEEASRLERSARAAIDAVAPVPDGRVLTTALAACRADGDLDDRRRRLDATRAQLERDAAAEITRLGLGERGATAAAVAALVVPTTTVVHDHADAWAADAHRMAELHVAIERLDADLGAAEEDLARLLERKVPTDDELRASRASRDAHAAGLRSALDALGVDRGAEAASADGPGARDPGRARPPDHSAPIEAPRLDRDVGAARDVPNARGAAPQRLGGPAALDAFEALAASIREADAVADRLRSSAADVARRARLEAHVEEQRAQRAALERQQVGQAERSASAADAWRALWRGVVDEPAPPREMFAWLEAHGRVVALARRLAEVRDELDGLDDRVEGHQRALRAALAQVGVVTPPDLGLASLVALATTTAADLEGAAHERAQLVADHRRLERARADAARAADDAVERQRAWRASWVTTLAPLELDPDQPIDEARTFVRDAASALDLVEAADRAEARLALVDDFVAGFSAEVGAVAARLDAGAAVDPDPVAVVRDLVERQRRADATSEQVRTLRAELAQHDAELAEARRLERSGDAHLAELLAEVGVTNEAQLRDAIARAERLAEVEHELERVERELLAQSGGRPADALEVARAGRDEHQLAARGEELDATLAEQRELLDRDTIELGQLHEQGAAMDGSAAAADAAAAGQMALAQVAHDAEEYLAVHLAALLLRDAIARYRERHQAPLLDRARPWFARLTAGSFATLDTDLDARGNTVLEAVRPDGERVLVSALSEGTRDQLFLALRLAAVSLAATQAEPMPLILDDLFVNFDEARTTAALEIFGELSHEMQVVLFTHHRHVADLARGALRPDRLHLHQLTPRAPGASHTTVPGVDPAAPVRLRPVS